MRTLAFVHIEKAAGTTFIHLLRRNYFLRYMDVRPVTRHGKGNLRASDLRVLSRLNPFLRCIAGHSLQTCSDIDEWRDDIQYVTILRSPVDRYISQFNYWNHRLGKNVSFEEFLRDESTWNFQTRKIAGRNDLEEASSQLENTFFHVGLVEQFDEFLLTLRRKLLPTPFDPLYSTKNTRSERSAAASELIERFRDEIEERNAVDLQLYAFAKTKLLPRYRSEYGADLDDDIRQFRRSNATYRDRSLKTYADYAIRKVYYETLTGLIRRYSGLPYRGSYETH